SLAPSPRSMGCCRAPTASSSPAGFSATHRARCLTCWPASRVMATCCGRCGSGALACIALDTTLQAIEVGEALFPLVMAGRHIDMPGTGQYRDFAAPVMAQLHGTGGAGRGVVVRTNQLAGERQRLAWDGGEIAQRLGAIAALHIGRSNQQSAAHTLQQRLRSL